MDDMFGFVGVLVLGCGLYGLYAWYTMRRDGEVNETLLLGKATQNKKCKDKEGFLKKAMPAVLAFGLVATIYGIIDVIHYYVTPLGILDTIGMVVFLVMLVWFMIYTGKIRNQYYK